MTKARFGNHPENRKRKAIPVGEELEKIKKQTLPDQQKQEILSSVSTKAGKTLQTAETENNLLNKGANAPLLEKEENPEQQEGEKRHLTRESESEKREDTSNSAENYNDLLSFVSSKTKKKEEVGMKQVILRVPLPLWKKVVKLKGNTSNQGLLLSLLEFYIEQRTRSKQN